MPSPHVDYKKGKKAIVYKAKKKRRKGRKKERNQISRACPKRLIAKLYAHIFNFFTLKSNISAQDSDQLSLLQSTNLLFGLPGLRSIPILDSSQIWPLQLASQLVHVASCKWSRCDGGFIWGHTSTTHNSPHEQVVAQIMHYVAPALHIVNVFLPFTTCHVDELWHKLCHFMYSQHYSSYKNESTSQYLKIMVNP